MNVITQVDAAPHPLLAGKASRTPRLGDGSGPDTQVGPVISCIPFRTMGEVIERRNATPSGLWARAIGAGSVWISRYQATDPAVPSGGYETGRYGREGGRRHVEEHFDVKAVRIRTAGRGTRAC